MKARGNGRVINIASCTGRVPVPTVGVYGGSKTALAVMANTMINFLLMQMNFHQVEEMMRLAAQLGVDQVNFKQCDVIRNEHGKGYGLFASKETRQVRRLEKSLSKVRRIAGSSFEASWSQYQNALRAAKEAMPEAPEGCNVCHFLFDI